MSIEYFSNEFSSSTWSKSCACPCTSSTQPFFFSFERKCFLAFKKWKGAHCAFFHRPDLPSSHFTSLPIHSSNDFKKGYLIHRPDCFLSNLLSDQLANWYYNPDISYKTLRMSDLFNMREQRLELKHKHDDYTASAQIRRRFGGQSELHE